MLKSSNGSKQVNARWRLLRGLVRNQLAEAEAKSASASVRRFQGYSLLARTTETCAEEPGVVRVTYTLPAALEALAHADDGSADTHSASVVEGKASTAPSRTVSVRVRAAASTSLKDMLVAEETKVDNTGNVCVWPSEECLAWYVATRAHAFEGKCVYELGAGMTGLAAVVLAGVLDQRKSDGGNGKHTKEWDAEEASASSVLADSTFFVSDGNPTAVKLLERNLAAQPSAKQMHAHTLKWTRDYKHTGPLADFVLVSDCLFFKAYHADLVHVLRSMLKHTKEARVVILGPKRGDTMALFLRAVRQSNVVCARRLLYTVDDGCYDARIHAKHTEKLVDAREEGVYDADIHFPVLVELSWQLQV
jgi:calmodulin-lysine N-methyltransferase